MRLAGRAKAAATTPDYPGSPFHVRLCSVARHEQRRSKVAAKKKKQRETIGGNPPGPQPKPKKQKKTSRGK
jgi:hypothetical protein